MITTHSPNIVKQLNFSDLRLIKDKNSLKTIENVEPGKLKYPSLNEVNYMAFGDATDEYHNELYGYIELKEWLSEYKEYKDNKKKIDYKKLKKNGEMSNLKLTLTEYIRHQIHHPENTNNIRFTEEQLRYSIDMMREFIDTKES